MMVQGSAEARTTASPASLLRPYAVTGWGGSSPRSGRPRSEAPPAAILDTSTNLGGSPPRCDGSVDRGLCKAAGRLLVSSRYAGRNAVSVVAAVSARE